jgi:hypothetical protein
MKRSALISITVATVVLSLADFARAQAYTVYYPATTYHRPATVYYASTPAAYYASPPTTVYYGAAPTTTYYASSPTTVYYGAAPTTVYYPAAPVTTYYRPLVGRGITRVGYYTPAVVYPAANTYQTYYPWW